MFKDWTVPGYVGGESLHDLVPRAGLLTEQVDAAIDQLGDETLLALVIVQAPREVEALFTTHIGELTAGKAECIATGARTVCPPLGEEIVLSGRATV